MNYREKALMVYQAQRDEEFQRKTKYLLEKLVVVFPDVPEEDFVFRWWNNTVATYIINIPECPMFLDYNGELAICFGADNPVVRGWETLGEVLEWKMNWTINDSA